MKKSHYKNLSNYEILKMEFINKKRKISYEYLAFTSKAAVCLRIN